MHSSNKAEISTVQILFSIFDFIHCRSISNVQQQISMTYIFDMKGYIFQEESIDVGYIKCYFDIVLKYFVICLHSCATIGMN